MTKNGSIRDLLDSLDNKWAKEADLSGKDHFSKTVSDLRKLMSQSLSEEEKLVTGKSMYASLRQNRKLETFPGGFQTELAYYFGDERTQGQKKADRMSPSQRPDLVHGDNQCVDAGAVCKQSACSPSQSRKRAAQSGEQENQDRAKLLERVNILEQDLEKERKTTKDQKGLLENRKLEITEKDEEMKNKEKENEYLAKRYEEENKKYLSAVRDAKSKQDLIGGMEVKLNEYSSQEFQLKQHIRTSDQAYKQLEKDKHHLEKSMQRDRETMKDDIANVQRKHGDEMKKLVVERDDLRDRFSKLAGAKLQDQNADIADLSDPNRAMKLSEKFGQIYDDEWTNAFELLTEKKLNMPVREAIALLLRILQDCLVFCNGLVVEQMDSLKSVILHPVQDLNKYSTEPRKNSGGMKDRPRIGSKDEQALRVLRRQIGVSDTVVEEIKQVFLLETRGWVKDRKSYEGYKKLLEACTPYIQKCAGICWLMVLHDPPLYMKMDSNPGEKLNLNIFTLYSTPGDKLDYTVWPPLFNGRDGGLLSKGSAEPLRTIVKKK